MNEEESLADQNSGQHCRLCLHWMNDTLCAEQFVDVFSYNENLNSTLAEQIHDCLGLRITPGDVFSNICLNCVHTISFIDEFRVLCHQTDKLYDSAQFRFSDVPRWKSYNDHVNELRVLVRGQRDWVDNILDDARPEDSVVGDDDLDRLCPEFIKVEEDEDEVEDLEENIYVETLPVVKNDVDPDETVPETAQDSDDDQSRVIMNRDSRFRLKLDIARELHAQMSDKPDFKAASRKLNLGYHEIKLLWRAMKKFYMRCKQGANAGHEASVLRCRRCKLFALMNVLVPKFDGEKPYKESRISSVKNNDGKKISIDLKVAIAEEIKMHPELWDISLKSSAHIMNIAWRKVTRKFAMDIRTLRTHWSRLRGLYRTHKLRELKGRQRREPASEKYEHLISVLYEILGSSYNIQLSADSTEQTEGVVGQENNGDDQKQRQLALAQEVQQYPIVWCYRDPDFHNVKMRDQTWEKIAESFATDCESVKREWRQLKDTFRDRHLRLLKGQLHCDDDLVVEPLHEVLDGMFRENMQVGSKGERINEEKSAESEQDEEDNPDKKFDKETMLEFAKVCHDYDILWNTSHPDYNAQEMRNEVWDLIALLFGVSVEKIKHEWKSLRGIYRSRYLRLQNSSCKNNDKKMESPLYQLMNSMFEQHMQVGTHGVGVATKEIKKCKETIENKPFSTSEDRMKLIEEITTYDIIWNRQNPNYNRPTLREPVFEEIATKFGHSSSIIKAEWKRLRRMHQHRKYRIAQGLVDSTQDGVDPLHTLLDKLLSQNLKSTGDVPRRNKAGGFPKRRYIGRRNFNNDECVKVEINGTPRYVKVCELCGKQIERSLFEYHMNFHYGITPYACSFEGCGKQYSNKITRDKHEAVVHVEDGYIFQCDQCDQKFKQKAKHDYHYAIKHKSEELPCNICGKVLPHKQILRSHMRIHAENYECDVCGKVLQKKYTLKIHMRVHTKEKPYPCELCDDRFMLKVQMKTHLLKVHGIVLEELQAAATANKS